MRRCELIGGGRAEAIQALVRSLGLKVNLRLVAEAEEFDASDRDEAIPLQGSPLAFENQPRLVALVAQHRLPAIYERRQFVDIGGLMSYEPLRRENFDRAAALVDKVLKDAKQPICRWSNQRILSGQ